MIKRIGRAKKRKKRKKKSAISNFIRASELPQFMNVEVFLSRLIRKQSRHVPLIMSNKRAAGDVFFPYPSFSLKLRIHFD